MRRTPLLTAGVAVSAVYAFSSHDWIGGVDVPTAVILTRHDQVASSASFAAACQAVCSDGVITGPDDPAAGRARC